VLHFVLELMMEPKELEIPEGWKGMTDTLPVVDLKTVEVDETRGLLRQTYKLFPFNDQVWEMLYYFDSNNKVVCARSIMDLNRPINSYPRHQNNPPGGYKESSICPEYLL